MEKNNITGLLFLGSKTYTILSGPTRDEVFNIRNFGGGPKTYRDFEVEGSSGEKLRIKVLKEYFKSVTHGEGGSIFEIDGVANVGSNQEPFEVRDYCPINDR